MRYERNVTVTDEWTGTGEEGFATVASAYRDGYRQTMNPSSDGNED